MYSKSTERMHFSLSSRN
uniref:Uncharacterized protein n=1 Tax=Arundo donax TaxID=35708 RepID=A0A0A8Z2F9_ARUDO